MFEDGMSLETFQIVLRWIYTQSSNYMEGTRLEEAMELIEMAHLLGLENLVRICEFRLSEILTNYPFSAETRLDFAERFLDFAERSISLYIDDSLMKIT